MLQTKKLHFTSLLFCMVMMISGSTHAALMNIVIDKGQVSGIPIAVLPFVLEGEVLESENIGEVIRADLQTSGQFSPLESRSIRQFPKQLSEVQYPYWQSTEVEDLVLGRIRKTGHNKYSINFEVVDVMRQKEGQITPPLLKMQFDNISSENFRALAHHISDLIFEKLIGVKGFFSSRIAYISVVSGPSGNQYVLEVADYDGHHPKMLFKSNYIIMSPAWSPDGKKLAFVSYEKERSSINIVTVRSGKVEKVTQFPGMNNAPAWSPDGKKLAMVLSKDGGANIYILDLESKQLRRLTSGQAADTEPSFAPDGQSLVFTSDRGGKPQTYRVILASGKVERVTFNGNYNAKPSLTPDGKNLVTLHRDQEGLFSIAVHSLVNGGTRILTQSSFNDSPSLAPNGMMVIYGSREGERGVLAAVTLDGRFRIRLPSQEGNVQEPAWAPFSN